MLGVSAHTIRAWERRHGFLHPVRTDARQRRYRREDVDLLREVKRAIDLNGLSVRLAFQSVTSDSDVVEPRAAATASKKRSAEAVIPAAAHGVWRAVGNVLPQLILLIDANGNIVEANTAVARAFDVVRQQLTGRGFASLVEPWDRDKAVLLYRPHPRAVDGWELNLATADGPRLFSFQSWPVRRDDDDLLALVGSQMYGSAAPRSAEPVPEVVLRTATPAAETPQEPGGRNALQVLVDHLPFGVALATIGTEPRLVYANLRLSQMLHVAPSAVTGRPVRHLLASEVVLRRLREAVDSRTPRTVHAVADVRPPKLARHARHFDIAFQPLFSSVRKVAGVLIVVQDAAVEATEGAKLEGMDADRHLVRAGTAEQLAKAGLRHLSAALGGVPVGLALPALAGSPQALTIAYPHPTRAEAKDAQSIQAFEDAVRQSAARKAITEIAFVLRNRRLTWTARPLTTQHGMGAVAWLTPQALPLNAARFAILEAFAARMEIATELLHERTEAARGRSMLAAIARVGAVMAERGKRSDLATHFLERLTRAAAADSGAILRVAGTNFVIEAVYPKGSAPVRPGESFPMAGRFVSTSLETRRPAGTSDLRIPSNPPSKRPQHNMSHAISVPLFVMGRATHVVTLARAAERPFGPTETSLVQALAGAALFCLAVSTGTPPAA